MVEHPSASSKPTGTFMPFSKLAAKMFGKKMKLLCPLLPLGVHE